MQNLEIEAEHSTYFVPYVNFNAQTGYCRMEGESYLEYTDEFYHNLTTWLKDYMNQVQKGITFHFRLTYYNTSSQKGILSLLRLLKKYQDSGKNVEVVWFYPEDDDDNLLEAEDFIANSGLEMDIQSYEGGVKLG